MAALFRQSGCEDRVKILIASTPMTGHLNPLLTIGRLLIAEGHEVVGLTGSALRERIEGIGAQFRPLPAGADFDLRDILSVVPELKNIAPGPQWLRVALEHLFVDPVPVQHKGLQQVLRDFPAEIVVGDDMFFGVLPMLLGPCSKRLPIVLCGISILHWRREDGAPHFLGLPPATTQAQIEEYAAISQEHDRVVNQPLARRLNRSLKDLGVGPLSMTLFDSVVELADAYMQMTVPSFEFPRDIPPSVHFIGALPIIPNQAPFPPWAHELDGSRKVVLVTQGTLANHNFGLLIAPTLAALANQPDLLVVVTAGGRPIDAIPGPIPNNARLASYLPFEWILPKVDVFVTNGGYGSVNQAMSFGIPLVTAGLTEDKADVNARVAWSGVGIDLATNEPTPLVLRDAVRTVLDKPNYRLRASLMAEEFDGIDTRSEILRIVSQVSHTPDEDGLRRSAVAENNSIQAHLNANHLAPID
jgi:UDP:flavonoid glycosyltransferase YjiC (YdhE family)